MEIFNVRDFFELVSLWLFLLMSIVIAERQLYDDCPQIHKKFQGFKPRGNTSAGKYVEVKEAATTKECVFRCCMTEDCNVALLTNEKCYHVTCYTNELCLPVKNDNDEEPSYGMFLVRAIGEVTWRDVINDLEMEAQGKHDQVIDTLSDPTLLRAPIPYNPLVKCVIGMSKCANNEVCMPNLPNGLSGICECKEQYTRNIDGACVPRTNQNDAVIMLTERAKRKLTVRVENAEIQMPQDKVNLKAIVYPEPQQNEKYVYEWTSLHQPEGSNAVKSQNGDELQLTKLSEGLYTFMVNVSSELSYGETYVNVTVLRPPRINKPPYIIITPANQTIKLPNTDAVLDASTSTDDDNIVSYHWELQQGPVGYQPHLQDAPMLELKDLNIVGNYTFKLTVTDTDKAISTATANITVVQTTDYPPEANAGTDVIVHLPRNNVTLNGTLSTDDHNITTWEWTKVDTNLVVDMQDARTPFLKLSNLEEGMYSFQLKVTDSANQTSIAKVHVFVKPPTNQPPIVRAGNNITISLPQTWVIVNANQSTDDDKISAYKWTQMDGPSNVVFTNSNSSVTNVTSLTKGSYTFKISVTDNDGNTASSLQYVTVGQNKNQKPTANAGGDFEVSLPKNVIYINGSRSSDDWAIVKWKWTRVDNSLAFGKIAENSDETQILILGDVVPGKYIFNLTVTDEQGLSDVDTVVVTIKGDPIIFYLVDMIINADIKKLTYMQYETMKNKLALIVQDQTKLKVRELTMQSGTDQVILRFYIEDADGKPMNANTVVKYFRKKLHVDAGILGFSIHSMQTVICQNNCSGHGICDERTRLCTCDTFWMHNLFKAYLSLEQDSDCSWSILYVVLACVCIVVTLVASAWGMMHLCVNRCNWEPNSIKPPSTYKLIENSEDNRKIDISDTDSDSDVVFESRNKGRFSNEMRNGHKSRNGFTKMSRRIKT